MKVVAYLTAQLIAFPWKHGNAGTPPPPTHTHTHKIGHRTLEFRCDSGNQGTAGWVDTWTDLGTLGNRSLAHTEIIIIIIIIIAVVVTSQTIKTVSMINFVLWPTNAQLSHKLSHSCYMFRHYCVIFREFAVSNCPCYTSMSNAAVGNTI